MNVHRMIMFATAACLATLARSQDCSGGPDGGMDANGNQCSYSNPVPERAVEAGAKPLARTSEKPSGSTAASHVAAQGGAAGRPRRPIAATASAVRRNPETVPVPTPPRAVSNNTAN